MRAHAFIFAIPLLVAACVAPEAAPPQRLTRPEIVRVGEEIARDLAAGRARAAHARFSDRLKEALPLDRLEANLAAIEASAGKVTALGEPALEPGPRADSGEVRVPATTEKPPGSFEYAITFVAGKVEAILVRPVADPMKHDRYETKARLRPPFQGVWTARNAARAASNHHFRNPNQRFAVDWVIEDADGKTHAGAGTRNEDYHCFAKPILAPADGVVVAAIDGIHDNDPGSTNAYFVPGNTVVLDLGGGEYAMFGHLKQGSVRVRPGDRVARGATIGLCGNSGNSTEPHLHFQLADDPRLERAASLPAKFTDVLLNGERAERAWPSEGDRLEALEPRVTK